MHLSLETTRIRLQFEIDFFSFILVHSLDFENQVDINVKNQKGETALMIAFRRRDYFLAKSLIEKGAHLDDIGEEGKTVLHHACERGKIELVHLLIEKSANLNIQDKEGQTPLMISLKRDYFMISEMLIDSNADLYLEDKKGENVWFYLCDFNSNYLRSPEKKFIKRIYVDDYSDIFTHRDLMWHFKTHKPDNDMVDALVKLDELQRKQIAKDNMNIQETRISKINELEIQFKNFLIDCHKRCLEKVSERSGWFDKASNQEETPLFKAVRCKSDKWIIELLLNKGANVSHRDNRNETVLSYALSAYSNDDTVELLINRGAKADDNSNEIPYLYLACNHRFNAKIGELLIQNGANLHGYYDESRVFNFLSEEEHLKKSEIFKVYRNALIKELYDTFHYTDYDQFKQRVIDSIDKEEIILLERDHLAALKCISHIELKSDAISAYFKSYEFREKLIVDYLNVLNDQKELLERKKHQFTETFPDLGKAFEEKNNGFYDRSAQIQFKELVSDEYFQQYVDSINMQSDSEQQLDEFTKILKRINEYIEIVAEKIKVGRKLYNLFEFNK